MIGVPPGPSGVADDRVFLDSLQPSGGPHPHPLLHVLEDGDHLLDAQAGAVEDRAFAFAEAFAADQALQNADVAALAGAGVHPQVLLAIVAEAAATRVLAAETAQILAVHDGPFSHAALQAYLILPILALSARSQIDGGTRASAGIAPARAP